MSIRRSTRLASKPHIQYYTEEDNTADTIQDLCSKKGYKYSEDFVKEFNEWYPDRPDWVNDRWCHTTKQLIPSTHEQIIAIWADCYSDLVGKEMMNKIYKNSIIKYCKKNNITYNPTMPKRFVKWMDDPANKHLTTTNRVHKDGRPYVYHYYTPYCINKWFSTL